MKPRILLAALALFAIATSAAAAPVSINWTLPTSFNDGTALAPADIASVRVQYSSGTTFGAVAGEVNLTGAAVTTQIDRPPGSWCFRASVTATAAKGGGTSTFSNVACKAVPFPNPNPPTIIDIIVAFLRRLFAHFV